LKRCNWEKDLLRGFTVLVKKRGFNSTQKTGKRECSLRGGVGKKIYHSRLRPALSRENGRTILGSGNAFLGGEKHGRGGGGRKGGKRKRNVFGVVDSNISYKASQRIKVSWG